MRAVAVNGFAEVVGGRLRVTRGRREYNFAPAEVYVVKLIRFGWWRFTVLWGYVGRTGQFKIVFKDDRDQLILYFREDQQDAFADLEREVDALT